MPAAVSESAIYRHYEDAVILLKRYPIIVFGFIFRVKIVLDSRGKSSGVLAVNGAVCGKQTTVTSWGRFYQIRSQF